MNEKFDLLIDELAENLSPVKTLFSPSKRLVIWLGVAILNIALFYFILPRGQFSFPNDPFDSLGLFSFGAFLLVGAYTSFSLVIPGLDKGRTIQYSLLSFGFLIFALLTDYILGKSSGFAHKRAFCSYEIILMSVIPFIHLNHLLFKGFLVRRNITFFLAGICASILPAAYMHVACSNEPLHALKWHIMPAFLFAWIGLFLMKFLIKRADKS